MTTNDKGAKPAPKKPVAKKKATGSTARARNTVKVHNADVALTALQVRFVEEYLVDLNATQAAVRAGYSQSTAKEIGYENLTKPHIQAAIAEARLKQQQRTEITADRVVSAFKDGARRPDYLFLLRELGSRTAAELGRR